MNPHCSSFLSVFVRELPPRPVAEEIYLTIDDGPSENTQKVLDILDQYGVSN